MSAILTRSPVDRAPVATESGRPRPVDTEFRAMADRLGQMDLNDPRWPQMEPALDACLLAALADDGRPGASGVRAVAADAESPRIAKLRALAVLAQRRRG